MNGEIRRHFRKKLHRSIAGKPNRPRLCPCRTGVVRGVPHSMRAPTPCSSPQFPNLDSHVQPDASTTLPTTGRNRLRTRTLCAGSALIPMLERLLTPGLQPYPSVANRTDSCFVSTTRAAPTTDSCSTSGRVTNARREGGFRVRRRRIRSRCLWPNRRCSSPPVTVVPCGALHREDGAMPQVPQRKNAPHRSTGPGHQRLQRLWESATTIGDVDSVPG